MPLQKKQFGGNPILGYRTLFANSRESQRLVMKYGLPPVSNWKLPEDFRSSTPRPSSDLTDQDIAESDLLRFNLGKFFWRSPKNTLGLNYAFINDNINYNSSPQFSKFSALSYTPPIRYQIGFKDNFQLLQDASYEAVSYKQDLNSVEFGNETFIILSSTTS